MITRNCGQKDQRPKHLFLYPESEILKNDRENFNVIFSFASLQTVVAMLEAL